MADHSQVTSSISPEERAVRNGHTGRIVWLTGLSGAGKSTIAMAMERRLFDEGNQVYVLDGDIVRTGLCEDLGFSSADRTENIRRIGEVAKILANAGVLVIVAFISPFRADRDRVRACMPAGRFTEVYVSTPLEVCEQRGHQRSPRQGPRGRIDGLHRHFLALRGTAFPRSGDPH